jgi:hypothetical protein
MEEARRLDDERRLVGIAVDVSGSMYTSLRNAEGPGLSRFQSIQEALDAISTRFNSLVRLGGLPSEASSVDVFMYGFGVRPLRSGVCDLLALLQLAKSVSVGTIDVDAKPSDAFTDLREIAARNGREGWGIWIAENTTEVEAINLAGNLRSSPLLAAGLGQILPNFSAGEIRQALVVKDAVDDPKGKTFWARMREARALAKSVKDGEISPKRVATEVVKSGGKDGIEKRVSHAQKLVQKLAARLMSRDEMLNEFRAEINDWLSPRLAEIGDVTLPISKVGRLLSNSSSRGSAAEEFIYGGTPMCAALRQIEKRFARESVASPHRIPTLLVVSDGLPMDGDPLPIVERMRTRGIAVVSCLVTDRDMQAPRVLPAKQDRRWTRNTRLMYKLASHVDRASVHTQRLVEWGWDVPVGARSFAQINHSDVLTEFLKAALG